MANKRAVAKALEKGEQVTFPCGQKMNVITVNSDTIVIRLIYGHFPVTLRGGGTGYATEVQMGIYSENIPALEKLIQRFKEQSKSRVEGLDAQT